MIGRQFRASVVPWTPRIARKVNKRQAWDAAAWNRLTSDWIRAGRWSADQELKGDLRTLRNRARERVRNSPFGARYVQLLPENVLGPYGMRLQAKNLTLEGDLFTRVNKAIETAWMDAGRVGSWDVEKRLTRDEQLNLAIANWGPDGEILFRLYRGSRFGKYGLGVQLLDPDYLDEEYNQNRMANLPLISQGVEYDDLGAPVAYYLWTRHPSDSALGGDRERVRVPASDIIHAFIPQRPGQSRGLPHLAPILYTLKQLDGYVEAELVAARTASAKWGAITDLSADSPAVRPIAGTSEAQGEAPALPAEADPGSLYDFRGMGATISAFDPQHPTDAFPEFTKKLSHMIAVGLGISYSSLTGDYADATYSSSKMGQQPERDHWRRYSCFIMDHVCTRLYREWLSMALLNGAIPGVTDYDVTRWSRVEWQCRGWPSPDPLKDAQADYMHVAAGTKTLTEIAAEQGCDLEEVLEMRRDELKMLAAYGVTSTLPGASPAPAPSAPSDMPSADMPPDGEDYARLKVIGGKHA